jgi:hypothetical protein
LLRRAACLWGDEIAHELRREDPGGGRRQNHQHARDVEDDRRELPGRLVFAVSQEARKYRNECRSKRSGHNHQEEEVRDAERRYVGAKRFRRTELARQHNFPRKSQDAADDKRAGHDPGRFGK